MEQPPCELSPREAAVLRGAANGWTYQEIAESLNLGYETINTHMKRIRKKLRVRNKAEMAVWAVRNQVV